MRYIIYKHYKYIMLLYQIRITYSVSMLFYNFFLLFIFRIRMKIVCYYCKNVFMLFKYTRNCLPTQISFAYGPFLFDLSHTFLWLLCFDFLKMKRKYFCVFCLPLAKTFCPFNFISNFFSFQFSIFRIF